MRNRMHVVGVVSALAVFCALAIAVGIDQAQGTTDSAPTFISPPARPQPKPAQSFDALTLEERRALLSNSLPGPRRSADEKSAVVRSSEFDPARARALVTNTPVVGKNLTASPFGESNRKVRVVSGVETPGGKAPYLGAARPAPELTVPKPVKSAEETAKFIPQPQEPTKYVVPKPRTPIDNNTTPSKAPSDQKAAAVSGDVIADAFPISVPASVSGSTAGYTDDYDETCPYLSPGAPDVVFAYTPVRIEAFSIDLCASNYDTKVYVYQDYATTGAPYACNDDYCGVNGYRSFIDCLTVFPGHTYYIVVDGYGSSPDGQEGDFKLELRDCHLGDRIDNAIPIASLPFSDSRNSGDFLNDYDEVCPFVQPGSPDVVFSYKPGEDQRIQIDLCNSQYDTKVYVYVGGATPGSPYQCNDDFCGTDGWRSFVPCFHVTSGETYYIVVDGYGGDAGVFDLEIEECCDGLAGCTPFSTPEGEICGSNPDVTNGGCNSSPFVTTAISPDQTVCGTAYWDVSTRDTDWYRATLSEGDSVTWCVTANFLYVAAIIVYDETQCALPTLISLAESDECTELCLSARIPADGDYAFFVAPSFSSPGLNCADGPWEYNAELRKICPPNVPSSGVVFEGEECLVDPASDAINGGCNIIPEGYSPIVPGVPVWGYGSWDGMTRDTDWFRLAYPLNEGDSVTWCVTANFAFDASIVDLRYGCGALMTPVFVSGGPCDTVYAGLRIDTSGNYAFFVAPEFAGVPYLCADGPWIYQATLFRNAACQWAGCLPGATPEGETCAESDDTYNGGCNSVPPVFQPINSGDHICGEAFVRADHGLRDTDWYEKVVYPGETVTWCVRAQFPVQVYMIDITAGCGGYVIIDGTFGAACEWTTVSFTALVKTDVAFFVAPTFDPDIPCATGPWQYDAFLDPGPTCSFPECASADVNENEPCVDDQDLFNAGCGSIPPRYTEIAVGQTFCGVSQSTPLWTDYDWYHCALTAGQVIRYTTKASYPMEAGVFDLTAGCGGFDLIAYGTTDACTSLDLTFTAPNTGDYAFALGPYLGASPPLVCEHGPWPYSGSIIDCACDCAHDPRCDSLTDIFDVTLAINVAFRDGAPITDPSPVCPWERTDVDCSGFTDILDVTHLINVAFRDGDPAVQFCDPCAALPTASVETSSSAR